VLKIFVDNVKNDRRRKDAQMVLKLMKSATGKKPKMWGDSIVGFGRRYYSYSNGDEGVVYNIGFSPRSQSLAFI